MVWLIGNKGMLGSDVELMLKLKDIPYIASDIDVDITDKSRIINFIDNCQEAVKYVINCSAYAAVDKAEDEQEQAFRINRDGVRNLAEISADRNIILIHISTDYVFDGEKKGEYLETDPTSPIGVYGKSKQAGELEIINSGCDFYIIRTAWLYGKNGPNFVYTMLRLFKEKETLNVVFDQEGSPTFAKDLASAITVILSNKKKHEFGIYHFTNEGKTTWFEFANQILFYANKEGLVNNKPEIFPISADKYITKAKRPANSYMSKEKIKSVFNINVRDWKEALKEFIKEITE